MTRKAWQVAARRGESWLCEVGRCLARRGKGEGDQQTPGCESPAPTHGTARQGGAGPGKSRPGVARRGRLGDQQASGCEPRTPTLGRVLAGHGKAGPAPARRFEASRGWARHGAGERHTLGFESRAPTHGWSCQVQARLNWSRRGSAGQGEEGGRSAASPVQLRGTHARRVRPWLVTAWHRGARLGVAGRCKAR